MAKIVILDSLSDNYQATLTLTVIHDLPLGLGCCWLDIMCVLSPFCSFILSFVCLCVTVCFQLVV